MPSSGRTDFLNLPQWLVTDHPHMPDEINAPFAALDAYAAGRRLQTYTALDQLGLSGVVTMEQACQAIPVLSKLIIYNDPDADMHIDGTPQVAGNCTGGCIICITRMTANFCACDAYYPFARTFGGGGHPSALVWTGAYKSTDNPAFRGWTLSAGRAEIWSGSVASETVITLADDPRKYSTLQVITNTGDQSGAVLSTFIPTYGGGMNGYSDLRFTNSGSSQRFGSIRFRHNGDYLSALVSSIPSGCYVSSIWGCA